jgi:hypothetical protein
LTNFDIIVVLPALMLHVWFSDFALPLSSCSISFPIIKVMTLWVLVLLPLFEFCGAGVFYFLLRLIFLLAQSASGLVLEPLDSSLEFS